MPLEHPDFLKNNPYYDDFSDEKNFLRVLFKPGYAVQARELTQLQTILQSQITKFADHFFKEGSKIFGGNVNTTNTTFIRVEKFLVVPGATESTPTETTVDSYLNTLKIDDSSFYVSNDENSSYIGSIQHIELEVYSPDAEGNYDFTEANGNIRLVHFSESGYSENDDYTILFANSVSGENSVPESSVLKVKNQEIYFQVITPTLFPGTQINVIEPSGNAILVSVDAGIYYTNGHFVNNKRQYFCVYNNSNKGEIEETLFNGRKETNALANVRLFTFPSARIGFTITRTATTVEEDSTLRDPASGFYNANAPGADRYKIDLILSNLPFDQMSVDMENYANKDFIQLVKIIKGNVDWIRRLPDYSEILDLFARRTYDESGSYTVKPFTVNVKNHLRRDLFELIVQNSPDLEIDDPNSYLSVGGYIWIITNSQSIPSGFPFNQSEFTQFTFPIAKIISVLPFKENDNINIQESDVSSKKILIQPMNSVRFSFDSSTFQNFQYKKSSISTITTISAKYSKFMTDSEGVYSVYDSPTGDNNKLVLSVEPGKAYVYGYEQEFYNVTNVEYNKGREVNDNTQTQLTTFSSDQFLGNYVVGNFIQDTISANIDTTIDWEKLPKFELQSDSIFTLIMEKGQTTQASGSIRGWSPFDKSKFPNENAHKMFGSESADQEFESVIVITGQAT